MDIPKILKFLYPNAIWSIGEDYESLKWPEQSDPKPSWQQLIDAEPAYLIQATIKEFGLNIQALIDSVAMQKQYETALHCASYAASTVDAWNIEAKHFIAWRDSVGHTAIQS